MSNKQIQRGSDVKDDKMLQIWIAEILNFTMWDK